ncbi:enoyl-CoA hydratase-related protein [Bacteroidota bacterium]
MEEFHNINVSVEDHFSMITINRSEKNNALNQATLNELRIAFKLIYDDEDILGVIITGSGDNAFAAGADISELADLNELNARKFSENGQEIFTMIEECPKPVIAAVNGYALGGGCELALACHIRIASVNAKFGQPEASLGIVPGYGGTQRLPYIVGKGKALEIMITGEMVNAVEALKYGLVSEVVESQSQLIYSAKEWLKKITKNAPLAVGMIIDCVNAAINDKTSGYQTEANSFSNCCKSEDFKEGTAAFLEKRPPLFKGK